MNKGTDMSLDNGWSGTPLSIMKKRGHADVDFSSSTPVKMLHIHAELSGDVAGGFVDYSRETDLKHCYRFCQNYGIDVTYEQVVKLTRYMESFECVE